VLVESVGYPADVDDSCALALLCGYNSLLRFLGLVGNLGYLADILAFLECVLLVSCGDLGLAIVAVDGLD
jgi:hypothetical protein